MCLMKLTYHDNDGRMAQIENVVSAKNSAEGLDIETLLDGMVQLTGCKISKVDCSSGVIETISARNGDEGHV